jgi:hypothetical protein
VFFHLALFFAELVKRLGDSDWLYPRGAEVLDIEFTTLDVFLVKTQAGKRCAVVGLVPPRIMLCRSILDVRMVVMGWIGLRGGVVGV